MVPTRVAARRCDGGDGRRRWRTCSADPFAAGVAVLNGCGELTGAISIAEWGTLETPIMLTGTSSVGRIFDATVEAIFDVIPEAGIDDQRIAPVVGECDDSWLDEGSVVVTSPVADGRAAIDAATEGPVAEGAVGAGTGMITMEHKAGIGTSSRMCEGLGTGRRAGARATSGAMRPAAHRWCPGGRDGSPPSKTPRRRQVAPTPAAASASSATDVPLDARQARATSHGGWDSGSARVGSVAGHC